MKAKELFRKPFITLAGEVNPAMVSALDNDLRSLDVTSGADPLRVLVSSGGGSVWFGEVILERLRLINTFRPVLVIVMTRIASAAGMFPLAVPRAQRYITSGAFIDLHQIRMDVSMPKQLLGSARDVALENLGDVLDSERSYGRQIALYARSMRMSEERLRQRMQRGWYISARQSVRLGLMGSIIH